MMKNKNIEKAMKIRKALKSKRPEFKRQDSHKIKSLTPGWRRPSGLHSKMRHNMKGYRRVVSQGFRAPVIVRGFHPKGEAKLCNTLNDLQSAKDNNLLVILGSNLGQKKRVELVKKADDLKLNVVNVKSDYLKKVQDNMQSRSKKKVQEVKKKETKKKDSETIEKKLDQKTDEEKAKEEHKLKDKVLTKSEL